MNGSGKAAIAIAAALLSLAAVGCAASSNTPSAKPAQAEPAQAAKPAQAGFAGYTWQVTTIADGGKPAAIPASYGVWLEFTPNGEFIANEPVNTHSGTYRKVGNGFTTSELIVSAVGSVGGSPTTMLAINAISAFDNGVHAGATVSGNRMTVSVGGYLLNCQREGQRPNFPPAPSSPPAQATQGRAS